MAGTPASVNVNPGCTQFHHPARAAEGRAQGFRSVKSWARSESTLSAFRLVRNLRKPCARPSAARACVDFGQPGFPLADAPTHNPYVGGLMGWVPLDYKVETKVERRVKPSSKSLSETQQLRRMWPSVPKQSPGTRATLASFIALMQKSSLVRPNCLMLGKA